MSDVPLKAWLEWKRKCAAGLCAPATRRVLRDFAAVRFQALMERYGKASGKPAAGQAVRAARKEEAWHLFEAHVQTRNRRHGLPYKEWIFAYARSSTRATQSALQLSAYLILRDVARRTLLYEHPRGDSLSLAQPVPGTNESLTLADLLPGEADPVDDVARHEYETLAERHASSAFGEASHRERVALLAHELGLSTADRRVEGAAGCRKTMLNAAYRALVEKIGWELKKIYPDDDAESVMALTLMTLGSLRQLTRCWGISEKSCRPLFLLVEDQAE